MRVYDLSEHGIVSKFSLVVSNSLQNSYPRKFINNVKRKIFNNTGNNNNSISTPKLKYCGAPYIKNVSKRIIIIIIINNK